MSTQVDSLMADGRRVSPENPQGRARGSLSQAPGQTRVSLCTLIFLVLGLR